VAKRSKDGSIIIYVGSDAQKHLERVAKREKIASKKAEIREAKKAATKQRQALRLAGKRAAQMARAIQRERDTTARRKAAREARRNWRPDPKRKKRSVHPKGPFATEKYNSYARRFERSRRLIATRTSPTTFTCNGYTIKVTAGANPKALSCTCPDFTQVQGGRDWKGTNAGPFNPCKHMMAVKDKWSCSGGVCSPNPFGIYNSEAECIAALVPASFTGGQCSTVYKIILSAITSTGAIGYGIFGGQNGNINNPSPNPARASVIANGAAVNGPVSGISNIEYGSLSSGDFRVTINGVQVQFVTGGIAGTPFPTNISIFEVYRNDTNPDNCGDPPLQCPI
jgi:hypothetical protein